MAAGTSLFFFFLKAHCQFFHATWWVSNEYPAGIIGKKMHLEPMAVFICVEPSRAGLEEFAM
jgi:hypothetical protein